MSVNVDEIIPISTSIRPTGLGFANFAKAVLFSTNISDKVPKNTYKVYKSLKALALDYAADTDTYKAANRWLGGIPATNELVVWAVDSTDASLTDTLNKARNKLWWFYTFVTEPVYNDAVKVAAVADWCNSNESFFMNCQSSGAAVDDIRNPSKSNDIASQFTSSGYRMVSTLANKLDPYAGIALCKWFASVNYQAAGTTITGEYRKLSGVKSEDLDDSAISAMKKPTKKCVFYTNVETGGSVDVGRVINSVTHSSYGEWIDDVINLAAFVNNLKVALYNAIANQPKKLGQDPRGQSILNGTAKSVCETYRSNNYLGPRNYLDPDDGVEKFTFGYEILTKPEEILDLLSPNRDARESAPLRIRIFRAGAIHLAPVDVSVY